MERIALYNDSFQNWKSHDIAKAQLILTDLPYQLGDNAFASSPSWYIDGDNKNGESKNAHKAFFDTDTKAGFRIAEFFHFCSNLLKKEPKGTSDAGCMILFCALEQHEELKNWAKQYGFNHCLPLFFYKKYSAQVLKANMRPVGNFETALIFYREKLPKFRNNGKMIFQMMPWIEDTIKYPKVHPNQKSVALLEFLIQTFTDVDDVVIDCCAGSGTTLLAAANLNRRAYGFELKKEFVKGFYEQLLPLKTVDLFADCDLTAKEEEKQERILAYGKTTNQSLFSL